MKRRRLYLLLLALAFVGTAIGWAARCGFGHRTPVPVLLASGKFHQVAHRGRGRATIYQLPGGKRILSLTDFRTSVGQELQVCLVAAADAFENETVERAGFISLGELQSAEGDQSYDLPVEVDLSIYKAVSIWSARYRVNFTTAPLTAP